MFHYMPFSDDFTKIYVDKTFQKTFNRRVTSVIIVCQISMTAHYDCHLLCFILRNGFFNYRRPPAHSGLDHYPPDHVYGFMKIYTMQNDCMNHDIRCQEGLKVRHYVR